jgi:hypothetical protein
MAISVAEYLFCNGLRNPGVFFCGSALFEATFAGNRA